MKRFFCLALLLGCINHLMSQSLFSTRQGQVSFSGKTSMENIEAVNNEVASALNPQTGELGFSLLIKSFHFERALMEEHFNENYMESDNLPKATFKGKITNPATINLTKDGNYPVTAEGELTIHGITKQVKVAGTMELKAGQPALKATFTISPKSYNIKIPSLVADKIAESMTVTVDCRYTAK